MASSSPDTGSSTPHARVLWQVTYDAEVRTAPLVVADGLLLTLDRGRGSELRHLALEDGATTWAVPLPHRAHGGPVRTRGVVALPLVNGQVLALHLDTGAPVAAPWGPLPALPSPNLGASDGVFFVRHGRGVDATLTAFVPDRPHALWAIPDPLGGADLARLRATDGVLVLAAAHDGHDLVTLAGVDPASGRLLWTHREPTPQLHDLWAIAGLVDVVTSSGVIGLHARTGELRSSRFGGFPLESARAAGEHLVAMMEGHMGPVLLCFHLLTQRLIGRQSRAMTRLVGAHAEEALVTLINGEPVFYALPGLEPVHFPEAEAITPPGLCVWSRDVCYVVSEDQRTVTAVDLDPLRRSG